MDHLRIDPDVVLNFHQIVAGIAQGCEGTDKFDALRCIQAEDEERGAGAGPDSFHGRKMLHPDAWILIASVQDFYGIEDIGRDAVAFPFDIDVGNLEYGAVIESPGEEVDVLASRKLPVLQHAVIELLKAHHAVELQVAQGRPFHFKRTVGLAFGNHIGDER